MEETVEVEIDEDDEAEDDEAEDGDESIEGATDPDEESTLEESDVVDGEDGSQGGEDGDTDDQASEDTDADEEEGDADGGDETDDVPGADDAAESDDDGEGSDEPLEDGESPPDGEGSDDGADLDGEDDDADLDGEGDDADLDGETDGDSGAADETDEGAKSTPAAESTGPTRPKRVAYFLIVGWWATGIWVVATWIVNLTAIGIPLGIRMIEMVPTIATLNPDRLTLRDARETDDDGPHLLVRVLYFFTVGFWLNAVWLLLAYVLTVSIVGLPVARWMYAGHPYITSMYRA